MRSIVSGTVLCLALAAIVSCSAPVRRDPANPAEVTHPREEVEFAAILRAEDRRIADADLLDLLGHAEARVRARAATAVARIGAPGARFALEPLLGDDSSEVRAGAAFGLGLLGERESLQALMRSAGDPEPSVRARAAEALGRLGVQEAVDAIGVLLRDPDAEVRAEACLAAWKLPDASSAVDGLIEGLGSESVVVRFGASYALGRLAASPFAPPSSGARVGRLSREDALRVREALVDQVASPLPELRMQVARGLASPGTTREEAAVGTLCADPVPGVRINAIRSFGYPGQRIDPFLRKALRDAHQGVVRAAIESLARVGGPGAAEILAKGIGRSSDRSAWVLEPATIGLAQVAPAATPEIVEGLTLNRDATMRAAVGQILAAGSDSRSQSYAARLLLDPVPKVRAAVVPIVATAPGTLEELLGPVREDPDPVVRAAVAGAAGDRLARTDLPEKDRREAISVVQRIWALSAPDALPDARVAALEAIAKGGPSEDARTMLDSGLASTDRLTRLRAIDLVRELYAEDRSALAGPAAERPLDDYLEILHWASRPRAAIVTVERRGFAPGRFTIRLETMLAPLASWNFAQLAESGFYDGLEVHRVVPNFVVQDGDPRGDGYGGPGHTIRDEFGPEHFWAGSVGMASAGRDTAGSQWFVTLAAQPHLDGRYTLFGRVVQNLDGVVAQIVPGDKVVSITTYEGDGTEPLPPR